MQHLTTYVDDLGVIEGMSNAPMVGFNAVPDTAGFPENNRWLWIDGAWTAPTSSFPEDVQLTPRQFNRFAALHGYDDAIEAVLVSLKSGDIEAYAKVKGDVTGAKVFNYDAVMSIIGSDAVSEIIPDGVDVSPEILGSRWIDASTY